jgi:hypothetical protein
MSDSRRPSELVADLEREIVILRAENQRLKNIIFEAGLKEGLIQCTPREVVSA